MTPTIPGDAMSERERTIDGERGDERPTWTDAERRERTTRPDDRARGSVDCELCEQRVPPAEAVGVDVGGAGTATLCAFCADSLFDVDAGPAGSASDTGVVLPDRSDAAGGRTTETVREGEQVRAAGRGEGDATARRPASAVTWSPPAVRTDGGLTGTLLGVHRLSLSLLWAIHRTNVRITERLIDEVDVELLAVLGTALSAVVAVAFALG